MQGRLELGVRAGILLLSCTRAFACMRTRTRAVGTEWAMHLLYRTAWYSGQAGAWGCAHACPHARVLCTRMLP